MNSRFVVVMYYVVFCFLNVLVSFLTVLNDVDALTVKVSSSKRTVTEFQSSQQWLVGDNPQWDTAMPYRRQRRTHRRLPSNLRQSPYDDNYDGVVDRGDQDAPVLVREELGCSPTLSTIMNFLSRLNESFATTTTTTTLRATETTASSSSSSLSSVFFFDPLNLANDDNFARYREAELKHGRIACLAVVGSLGVTYGKDEEVKHILKQVWVQWFASSAFLQVTPPSINDPSSYDSTLSNKDGVETSTSMIISSSSSVSSEIAEASSSVSSLPEVQLWDQIRHLPIPAPIHLFYEWTLGDFARMIVFCGIIETLVWVQTDPQAMPGDYGIGYFGVRDKGLHERSLVAELENGRVCMLVMLYYFLRGDIWAFYENWR